MLAPDDVERQGTGPPFCGEPARGRRGSAGRQCDDAAGRVDVHVEVVQEVAPQEAVGVLEIDIVGDDDEGPGLGLPDLDGLHAHDVHARGSRRAPDLGARGEPRGDPETPEREGIDHGGVGAGVEHERHGPAAVDLGVDQDGFPGLEGDLRDAGRRPVLSPLGSRGRGRERHRPGGRAEALGNAVEPFAEVDPALVVHPADHLGVGGDRPRQEDQHNQKRPEPSHRVSLPTPWASPARRASRLASSRPRSFRARAPAAEAAGPWETSWAWRSRGTWGGHCPALRSSGPYPARPPSDRPEPAPRRGRAASPGNSGPGGRYPCVAYPYSSPEARICGHGACERPQRFQDVSKTTISSAPATVLWASLTRYTGENRSLSAVRRGNHAGKMIR